MLSIGTHRPRVSIVEVTPDLALQWLEKEHPDNRVTKTSTAKYTQAMKDGAWRWSPDGISFAVGGTLINGANRLRAIVESGVTILMTVWFDCPQDVFAIIDRGQGRTLWQAAAMAGDKAPKEVFHMARTLAVIDTNSTAVSDSQVLVHIGNLQDAWRFVSAELSGMKLNGRNGLRSGAMLALCIAWFSDSDVLLFARELKSASDHSSAAGPAVRNYIRWYENSIGSTGFKTLKNDAHAMSAALRQYQQGKGKQLIRPTEDAWEYWRQQPAALKAIPFPASHQ